MGTLYIEDIIGGLCSLTIVLVGVGLLCAGIQLVV